MNELVVFNEVVATIAEYKDENKKLVFDYANPKGEKEARSHIANLRTVKTKISDVHKEAKAEALAFCKALDGKKRELIGEVEGMIAVHKEPLDVIEAEKVAQAMVEVNKRKEEEAKKLAEIEAREAAVKEAEEKIAREKADAERAERDNEIRARAAESARIQAEQKAKIEADAKELAEKKHKEAEEAKEKKRINNKNHREKIEGKVRFGLTEIGFNPDVAYNIFAAIKENRIPHVSINY